MPKDVIVVVDQVVDASGESYTTSTSPVLVVCVDWSTTAIAPILSILDNTITRVGPPRILQYA